MGGFHYETLKVSSATSAPPDKMQKLGIPTANGKKNTTRINLKHIKNTLKNC